MYFFFDESGDYAFGNGPFDCYVQAVLISPDSALTDLPLGKPLRRFRAANH